MTCVLPSLQADCSLTPVYTQRLNILMFSSNLDGLILVLNLLLHPAQQYSSQPAVSHALSISTLGSLRLPDVGQIFETTTSTWLTW